MAGVTSDGAPTPTTGGSDDPATPPGHPGTGGDPSWIALGNPGPGVDPGWNSSPVPRRRPRWWLVALVVAWILVVIGAGLWAVRDGQPTVREQTTIAQALPTVDEAVARSVLAAGTDRVVAVLGGYEQLSADCRVTAARGGATYARSALLFTAVGAERALLERIADGLPASYQAGVGTTLFADAGNFVRLRGLVVAEGQVKVTADTGCRPLDRPVTEAEPQVPATPGGSGSPPPPGARTGDPGTGRAAAELVLEMLDVQDAQWQAHQVRCPNGGTLWTIEAAGGATGAGRPLREVLTAEAVLAGTAAYAYRSEGVDLVVQVKDGVVTVDATGGC